MHQRFTKDEKVYARIILTVLRVKNTKLHHLMPLCRNVPLSLRDDASTSVALEYGAILFPAMGCTKIM